MRPFSEFWAAIQRMHLPPRVLIVMVAALAIGLVPAFNPTPMAAQAEPDVRMLDSGLVFRFEPPNVEIRRGDSVTWRNDGDFLHTTTRHGQGGWDSGIMSPGAEFTHVFDTTGAFPYVYVCEIHQGQGMEGTITVVDPQRVFLPLIARGHTAGW